MDKIQKRMRPLLGTFVEITIHSIHDSELAFAKAFDAIKTVHDKLSFHNSSSELNLLNNADGKPVELSPISLKVIRLAKATGIVSDERFNCTIGNCFKAVRDNELEFYESSRVGKSKNIIIKGREAQLTSGVKIILDGIAKGFAVDLAIKSLLKSGVTSGLVNAGGDIRVFGNNHWPIQISTPNNSSRRILYLKNAALATSTYSNQNNVDYPAKIVSTKLKMTSNFGTWSVISSSTWRADALTKVAANSSETERQMLISRLGGVLVSRDGNF